MKDKSNNHKTKRSNSVNSNIGDIEEFVAKYEKEYYKFFSDMVFKTLGAVMSISEDGRGFCCADEETQKKIRMLIPYIELAFAAKLSEEEKQGKQI